MNNRLFGTDGVRGLANREPVSADLAFYLGRATALHFGRIGGAIVIGRDTRISGDMLNAALVAGITSTGTNVINVGVLPTPAVAYLTRTQKALAGIVISASHNDFEDNGIKLFGADGHKLTDQAEDHIASLYWSCRTPSSGNAEPVLPVGREVGRLLELPDAAQQYQDFLRSTVPTGFNMQGLTVVIDCAHGAASLVAPEFFQSLGPTALKVICNLPDGTNINEGCGSLHTDKLAKIVVAEGYDIGFCFDGDADRMIAVAGDGTIIDGDYSLAICARYMQSVKSLANDNVVSTVMSNLGLEKSLASIGVTMERVAVGDRYVLERMRENGATLGGEQSGHLIFLEHHTTGDGMLSALQLALAIKQSGQSLADLRQCLHVYPQVLINRKVAKKLPFEGMPAVQEQIGEIERRIAGRGRLVLRYSGTENLVRVMMEGDDLGEITALSEQLAELIVQAISENTLQESA